MIAIYKNFHFLFFFFVIKYFKMLKLPFYLNFSLTASASFVLLVNKRNKPSFDEGCTKTYLNSLTGLISKREIPLLFNKNSKTQTTSIIILKIEIFFCHFVQP